MEKILIFVSLFIMALNVNAKDFDSHYTSIDEKDCQTQAADNLGSLQICPSFAGITVQALEGDLRQSITLIRNEIEYPLEFWRTVSSSFSALGSKIEWRYKIGKADQPFSMITRLNVSDDPANFNKRTSYLIVSKITADDICVVGKISPQPKQNQKAREMAEQSTNMPCIDES